MTFHSQFRKGQRVLVILNNGDQIVDKYVGTSSKWVHCEQRAFCNKTIRAISIYKEQPIDKLSNGIF